MDILALILIGVVGGVLGGMGMGGGTLLIPLLTIFLGISQNIAQGINLLAFLPMSLVALFIHFKNRMVDIKSGWPVIMSGILSAVGGAYLANLLNPKDLKVYFAIFLIVLGIFQFVSLFIFKKNFTKKNADEKNN